MAACSLLRTKQVPAGRERPWKEKSWRYRNQTSEAHTSPFIPTLGSPGIGSASKQAIKVGNPWYCISVVLSYLDFPKAVQTHWEDLGVWRDCHALQSLSLYVPITRLQLGFPPEPGICGASQSSKGSWAPLSAHLPPVALVSKCQTLGSWGQRVR